MNICNITFNTKNGVKIDYFSCILPISIQTSTYNMSFLPRSSQFATEAEYKAALAVFEAEFMRRLGRVPTQDFSTKKKRPASMTKKHFKTLTCEELEERLDECCVCYSEMTRHKSVTPSCQHTFCAPCMTKCLSRTSSCPYCRTKVDYLTRYRAKRRPKQL